MIRTKYIRYKKNYTGTEIDYTGEIFAYTGAARGSHLCCKLPQSTYSYEESHRESKTLDGISRPYSSEIEGKLAFRGQEFPTLS